SYIVFHHMKKLLTRKTALIAFGLVMLAGILAFSMRSQKSSSAEFFTSRVDAGALRNVVNATGVVQTVVTVQVGSQVSGQVQEIYADFNSVVKRGQLLAKLDPRNFNALLQNSEATVASAQARVRGAEADIETNRANLQSSKASLEAAKVTRDTNLLFFNRATGSLAKGVISQN